MSSGNTINLVYMRQRLSQEQDPSDEEEATFSKGPMSPRALRRPSWLETIRDILWIVSAVFVIYMGDRKSNFIYLLWRDKRIKRLPLYLGSLGVLLNIAIVLYSFNFAWYTRKANDILEALSPSCALALLLLGFLSFCLLSVALWPIWSFLSLPLLLTLCMSLMVVALYMPLGGLRPDNSITFHDNVIS